MANMYAKFYEEAHISIVFSVHKLISIYVNCDLDLWPLASKINRVHPLTMANMSAKFDEEAHKGLVSIVSTSLFQYANCDLGLWPPKSIGSILSIWLIFVPSFLKKHTIV